VAASVQQGDGGFVLVECCSGAAAQACNPWISSDMEKPGGDSFRSLFAKPEWKE